MSRFPISILAFDRIARSVFGTIPPPFAEHLSDIVLRIEEWPTQEILDSFGMDDPHELTGLYEGIPVGEKSEFHASDGQGDRITLYRQPLLAEMAETGVTLEALIRHVVIHEVGHHFGLSDNEYEPLYIWAISAKRYALFNLNDDGQSILRKASAHGLGHLLAPYDENNRAKGIPEPSCSLSEIGVELWHHDLWLKIIEAALAGHADQVALDYHPALGLPAMSRYTATSPTLLDWFASYNAGLDYRDQIKPFNFLTVLRAWPFDPNGRALLEGERLRRSSSPVKPVSPYTRDPSEAARTAFDRIEGEPIDPKLLLTYQEALAQYHLHPENKFLHGDFLDRGSTKRRHVQAFAINNIGKEANDWERQARTGFDPAAQPGYGFSNASFERLRKELRELSDHFSMAQIANAARISDARLREFISGKCNPENVCEIARSLSQAIYRLHAVRTKTAQEINALKADIVRDGLRKTARRIGVDPSNLRRKVRVYER